MVLIPWFARAPSVHPLRWGTATSRGSQTMTFTLRCWRWKEQTSARPTSRVLPTRRKRWASSSRSWWWSSRTWRSISHLKSRCWMIKTSAGGFAQVTTRARRAWSRSSAQCRWGWMTGGTRFSSTCRTSPAGRTEPTTSRRCVYRSTQTVEYGGCTSPTDCTRRTSCQQSLNSTCLSRTKKLSSKHQHQPAPFLWSVAMAVSLCVDLWLTINCCKII